MDDTQKEPHELTTAERVALLEGLKVTLHAYCLKPSPSQPFVTYKAYATKNDNAEPSTFRYELTLSREDGKTLRTPYSAGLGHVEVVGKMPERLSESEFKRFAERKLWQGDDAVSIRDFPKFSGAYSVCKAVRKVPTLLDVLYCLTLDAQSAESETFVEWCDSLGHDSDSRKAEQTYNACRQTASELAKFFSRTERAVIARATEGY